MFAPTACSRCFAWLIAVLAQLHAFKGLCTHCMLCFLSALQQLVTKPRHDLKLLPALEPGSAL